MRSPGAAGPTTAEPGQRSPAPQSPAPHSPAQLSPTQLGPSPEPLRPPARVVPVTGLVRQVAADLRWAFTRPWTWLSGVAVNLVLSLLYLVVFPLTGRPHSDWAILVGTYFAVWILADVTTTNVLGADAGRVRSSRARGIPLHRILVVKNLVLLLIVGVPTALATALITLHGEGGYRLELTVPGVLFPTLTWLGVGNLVSVALPVSAVPLRQRWAQRRDRPSTVRWLAALVLPYVLVLGADPMDDLPRVVVRGLHLSRSNGAELRGSIVLGLGLVMYAIGTAAALAVVRRRGIRFDGIRFDEVR